MKEKITKIAIVSIIIIIMCIPIISEMVGNDVLPVLSYKKFDNAVSATSDYGFALIYVGDNEDQATKEEIKNLIKNYETNPSGVDGAKAYFMDIKDLSAQELEEIVGTTSADSAYVFVSNGTIIRRELGKLDNTKLDNYVSEYSVSYNADKTVKSINEDITYYKVIANAREYEKLVKDKKLVTMAVFGRDTCFYCNQFKPVYNTVAEEYDLDIYYFDNETYDEAEYKKIMNLGLKVPAECTGKKVEAKLADGFNTPLTIFTKNGKTIDCISGYITKDSLITKLKTVGMISE